MGLDSGGPPVIDADAHVIESDRTWDYLEPEERKFRPELYAAESNDMWQYWVIPGLDTQFVGVRFPTLSESELSAMSKETGRNLVTKSSSREMDDVALRLAHMDELGIDVQVLHNTLWIEQVTDNPAIEVALCGSWNRWMADVWRQGGGRLRWSAVVPMMER
jgi:predicted TIM-barrel fold metal-dependent hydrolase